MNEANHTGVKLPFAIQRPSQGTPATRVADIDDDNGVNLGTILSGKLNATDAQSTYEPKLTGAKLSAVESGITSAKRSEYDKAYNITYKSTNCQVNIPIIADKAFTVSNNGEYTIQLVDSAGATVQAMTSKPFRIVTNIAFSFLLGNERGNYNYYFAIRKNGTWEVAKEIIQYITGSATAPDIGDDPNFVNSVDDNLQEEQGQEEQEQGNTYVQNVIVASDYIGCECRLFVVKDDNSSITPTDYISAPQAPVVITSESLRSVIKQYAVFAEETEFYGDSYFRGKVYKGYQGSNDAREIDKFYESVQGTLTYKAKLVNDEYICVPVEQADNTYTLFVGVISVSPMHSPSLYLSNSSTSFFAKKGTNFANDNKIVPLGKMVENVSDTNEVLIVATTNSLGATITNFSIEQAIKNEIASRMQLASVVAGHTQAINNISGGASLCPWAEYNTLTPNLPNTLPNAGTNGIYEWDDGEGTITGHIDVDATKGNRIFDLRKLDSESEAVVDVDIRGITNYETIIYYRGFDTISLNYISPLTVESFSFLNDEPSELDTDKEYVLSIQGNTIAYGTLTKGVSPVVEVEE